ncbi:hypothetical protein OIU77_008795 [Salix suchowensis]|uniref:Uncharacterized protein n=1 Tax=Salix suchowensis TaxID=1278906 RepID=A0ABQ9ACM9_9ROSI|nr:hypothetical protein OIU77_008795 [Salix suchowensis]
MSMWFLFVLSSHLRMATSKIVVL